MPPKRRVAIEEMVALLARFSGAPVEKAKAHAEPACEPQLDEEELIDELTEFLHVSRHSDGFGFDLLGWLPPDPERRANRTLPGSQEHERRQVPSVPRRMGASGMVQGLKARVRSTQSSSFTAAAARVHPSGSTFFRTRCISSKPVN